MGARAYVCVCVCACVSVCMCVWCGWEVEGENEPNDGQVRPTQHKTWGSP
jgi:hypothetical protein